MKKKKKNRPYKHEDVRQSDLQRALSASRKDTGGGADREEAELLAAIAASEQLEREREERERGEERDREGERGRERGPYPSPSLRR